MATALLEGRGVADGRAVPRAGTIEKTVEDNHALEVENRRLCLRVAELESALARAGKVKTEFLALVSHELRTPLMGILGMSEVLQDGTFGAMPPRQTEAVRTIEESGRQLLNLINDMLDLSQIELGRLEVHPQKCSIEAICRASLALVRESAASKKLRVSHDFPPQTIDLDSDARRLEQVLGNLLSNAVKFTPPEGRIGLSVQGRRDEGWVECTVWDTGIGIAAADVGKLFSPFTQLDGTHSRHYSGTGLGLALVHRLTSLLGGQVTVQSTPGQGSRFTVTLPWPAVRSPSETGVPSGPQDRHGARQLCLGLNPHET